MVKLQDNDILLAIKAINLHASLSKSARMVAGALIDHFNRKTGQCDPSVGRLATLLGINRATVMRATTELEKFGLFAKLSHGGYSHRASYQPQWQVFREFEDDWSERMKTGKAPAKGRKAATLKVATMRGSESQDCDVKGRKTATQTNRTNQSNKPVQAAQCSNQSNCEPENQHQSSQQMEKSRKGLGMKGERVGYQQTILLPIRGGRQTSHSKAAKESAIGRINDELLKRGTNIYAAYVDLIDPVVNDLAAEKEMKQRGSGVLFIVEVIEDETLKANRTRKIGVA